MKTPQELVDHVVAIARDQIRPKLAPDGDWEPVLFVWNGSLLIVGLEFETPEQKQIAYGQLAPALIRKSNAWMAATVNTAWTVKPGPGGKRPQGPFRDVPGAAEVVFVQAVDWAGNTATWAARIVRSPTEPPQLVVDEQITGTGGGWRGGLVDPIAEALKANRSNVEL